MPAFSRFLRYFLAVARCGSIRRASEELHVAASAIDRQILLGEKTLGTPLFERLPGGMRLTAAGELVYHRARGWSGDLDLLLAQLDDLRGLRRGHVTLAVVEALAQGFVPEMIARLSLEHRLITASLLVMGNAEVNAAIADGTADFGLQLNPLASRDVEIRVAVEIPLGFVSPPGHPIAATPEARFSACVGHRLVAPLAPLQVSEQLKELEAATGVTAEPACSADNIQMIKSLVRAGVGVGVLSALDAAHEIRRGELVFTPITNQRRHPFTLALSVHRSRQLSAAARLLIGWMEAALPELAASAYSAD